MLAHNKPITNNRRFDAVIFDLGNTLIYFDGEWSEVFQESDAELLHQLHTVGIHLDHDVFTNQFRARLEEYFSKRETDFIEYSTTSILRTLLADWGYNAVSDDVIKQSLAAMYAVSQAHWHPELDAVSTIQTLQKKGYRLGIISNAGDDADVQVLVDKAGLRPYFDVILSSAAQGIRKPSPRIFKTALDYMGVVPSKAAMVGDNLGADILGAHNTGMFGIWITRRADLTANRNYENTIQPDAVVDYLSQLPGYLDKLGM